MSRRLQSTLMCFLVCIGLVNRAALACPLCARGDPGLEDLLLTDEEQSKLSAQPREVRILLKKEKRGKCTFKEIAARMKSLPGVKSFEVNPSPPSILVTYFPEEVSLNAIHVRAGLEGCRVSSPARP